MTTNGQELAHCLLLVGATDQSGSAARRTLKALTLRELRRSLTDETQLSELLRQDAEVARAALSRAARLNGSAMPEENEREALFEELSVALLEAQQRGANETNRLIDEIEAGWHN